jgi:hypothetical protein
VVGTLATISPAGSGPPPRSVSIRAPNCMLHYTYCIFLSTPAYNRLHVINAAPVPPMYLTDNPSECSYPRDNLQIASIKIASIRGGLRWPIDVFGMVTARDVLDVDRKRNIVYARARSNCQTITEEVIHTYICIYSCNIFFPFIMNGNRPLRRCHMCSIRILRSQARPVLL